MNKGTHDRDNNFFSDNGYKSIRINFTEKEYERIMSDNKHFKERLNFFIKEYPDLFPAEIKNGYYLYGKIDASKKQNNEVRRINIKGMSIGVFQIYPSFVMPYMTGLTDEAWEILLLSMYRVPEWVLAKVFDKDEKHIQRLHSHLWN